MPTTVSADTYNMVALGLLLWVMLAAVALAYELGSSSMRARNRWRTCVRCRAKRAAELRARFEATALSWHERRAERQRRETREGGPNA